MDGRFGWVLAGLALAQVSCGALWTEPPPAGDDSVTPVEGLSADELLLFAAGDEIFEKQFTASEGLGPVFVQVSCEACHLADSAGHPDNKLIRYSRGSDPLVELGGPQLQHRAIGGVRPERLPGGVQTSTRVAPVVHGMGLIEAIEATDLLRLADPDDRDGDGISGRPNCVPVPTFPAQDPWLARVIEDSAEFCGPGTMMGRFGLKSNNASLLQQVVGAYQQDMGITSEFAPEEPNAAAYGGAVPGDLVPEPEISSSEVQLTTSYVRMLAPPAQGRILQVGATLFSELGCDTCHTPQQQTGSSIVPALAGKTISPYSDFLLHDMGDALADGRPDESATGREWRTTPLWGLRIKGNFTDGTPYYLHDGRTSDLHQAIVLHGGEALASREAYETLSPADQAILRDFLGAL